MASDNSDFTNRHMYPEDWENIKREVHRLYILEKKTLPWVQAQLQAIHGFHACFSTWKAKVKEWNFSKNLPGPVMHSIVAKEAQRTSLGKRTAFFCENTPITGEKIDNFKKKHCRGFAPSVATALPDYIRYHTPDPDYENPKAYLSTSTEVQSESLGHACSLCSQRSETEPGEIYRIQLPDDPRFRMIGSVESIDGWLADEHWPWSHFELSHQNNHREDATFNDHSLSDENTKFELPSENYDVWPDVSNIRPQAFLGPQFIMGVEQEDEVPEGTALEDLSTLSRKLAQYLRQDREYDPQALKVRFKLAEALVENSRYDEAEEHCHDLIAIDYQENVATLLGTIFARTNRLEESTKWLSIALTNFILDFTNYSLQQNERNFRKIYYLFAESIWHTEQDWECLTEALKKMMVTLDGLEADERACRPCPEIFIHGFNFAQECTAINLVQPAKHLYHHLLERSSLYLRGDQAIEKAKAHQMYGLLLGKENQWSASAKQLLLTCESAIESGAYSQQYITSLTLILDDLRPHLQSENDRAGWTVKEIENKLVFMKTKVLDSPWVPGVAFATAMPPLSSQLTLPVRSNITSQGRTASISTGSRRGAMRGRIRGLRASKTSAGSESVSWNMSGDGSHENGNTYPTSEWDEVAGITGICDGMSTTS